MSLVQLTFAELERKRARRHDPDTSKTAARMSHRLASEHERIILEVMGSGAQSDWTPEEISDRCRLTPLQVSRRIRGLFDDGRIRETLNRRPTWSGRPARCWELVP